MYLTITEHPHDRTQATRRLHAGVVSRGQTYVVRDPASSHSMLAWLNEQPRPAIDADDNVELERTR